MGEVKVTKGSSLVQSGGQTEGMLRMNAITDLSDQICGSRALLWNSLASKKRVFYANVCLKVANSTMCIFLAFCAAI